MSIVSNPKISVEMMTSYIDVDAYLREVDSDPAPVTAHPFLPKRIQALRIFAETTIFRSVLGQAATTQAPGITKEECDARVGELLAVTP